MSPQNQQFEVSSPVSNDDLDSELAIQNFGVGEVLDPSPHGSKTRANNS